MDGYEKSDLMDINQELPRIRLELERLNIIASDTSNQLYQITDILKTMRDQEIHMKELKKIRAGVDNLYATAGLDYSLDMMEIKLLLTDIKESVRR